MATHEPEITDQLTLDLEDNGRSVSAEEFANADYLEPWRYERVAGRLVVMAPDGGDHVETASPWLERLILYRVQHPEIVEIVVPNAWVRIDDGTDRIGDIGIYLIGQSSNQRIPDRTPELMFEIVSPGSDSRKRDYIEKRAEYHRLGIREYVVVDRFKKRVTIFTREGEAVVRERVLTVADTYETVLLPGLAIPLAEVFRR
ncbi:Uma2 family endonuclease [Singulisphaera rosea]